MKGPGVCGIGVDVAAQLASQIRDGSEDAACNHLALDSGKPKFDLVQPGRVSGGEVQMYVGVIGKEILHQLGFVCREVIQNDMDLFSRRATANDVG